MVKKSQDLVNVICERPLLRLLAKMVAENTLKLIYLYLEFLLNVSVVCERPLTSQNRGIFLKYAQYFPFSINAMFQAAHPNANFELW